MLLFMLSILLFTALLFVLHRNDRLMVLMPCDPLITGSEFEPCLEPRGLWRLWGDVDIWRI